MQRTQIYFPKNQLRLLKQLACAEEVSLSEIVRSLAEKGLEEEILRPKKRKKRANTGGWLLSLAREAKRLKIKGPRDLSLTIDNYLYQ